jgi:protein O-mannosyl-transferase
LGLLLVLATLALYNPVSRHPFVNYDDDRYVTDNAQVRAGLHWRTVRWAFTSYDEANWHPLTWLSHALDCQLFGLNPAGHHYVNLLLHAANVMLLFWILWRATGCSGRSLAVAALFALHPVNVESVAWVAERKNILSMLFFLLALGAYQWYTRRPHLGRYVLVVAMYACGLMAKPMVITFPFILLLWDYWPLRRWPTAASESYRISWLALEKAPLLLLSAASAIVTVQAQRAGKAVGSMVKYPLQVRLENMDVAYLRYLGNAVWPSHLAPMYLLRQASLTAPLVVTAALILLTITALVIAERRQRYLMTGWLWFLGALVPMIGIVQVGVQTMADRYAYLPFVGLFIMVCWGIADLAGRWRVSQAWLAGGAAVSLIALAMVTHRQVDYWSGNLALWAHTAQVTKDNFIAEDNLGGALLEEGKPDEARPHFQLAAQLNPTDPMSRLNLAANEQWHGHLAQAVEQFKQVVQMTDDSRLRATALTNLGYSYRGLGDLARAQASFQAAVSVRPRNVRAWLGLGLVCEKIGDYAGAISAYSEVIAIQPDLGYYMLGHVLEQNGRIAESRAAMEQARRVSPNFTQLREMADSFLAN